MELLLNIAQAFIFPFYSFPPLAFAPAILFVFFFVGRYHFLTGLAGFLWLLYGIYECILWATFREADMPIRVDLTFIAPILLLVTLLGLWPQIRPQKKSKKREIE